MTKALERAALALLKTHDCSVDLEAAAKAALLAALDPEDEELAAKLAEYCEAYSENDWDLHQKATVKAAITALRNHICGESSDDG